MCDPTHPCGSTAPFPPYYQFDGDNRIKTANGGASSGGATYLYDGDGRRVKKIIGGPTPSTTVFVYDLGGQMIAEYCDQQPTGGGTSYLTADHLGTPRVITRADGSVSGRHDYQPFGEEISSSHGGRTDVAGYPATDGLRQQFTQKERDVETGLDYFLARYYSSIQGRFLSPDEFTGGPDELYDFVDSASENPTFYADLTEPQSLNKYQYAYNNPLRYVDPDGHEATDEQEPQSVQAQVQARPILRPVSVPGPAPRPVRPMPPWLLPGPRHPGYEQAGKKIADSILPADVDPNAIPPQVTEGPKPVDLPVNKPNVSSSDNPEGKRKQVFKKFPSRKRAIDARPRPRPASPGAPRVTRQKKNKKGMGSKSEKHKNGDRHFHDDRHNDRKKPNVHYGVP